MATTANAIAAAAGPDWIYDPCRDYFENTATGVCITYECIDRVLHARVAREPGAFGIPGLGVTLEPHMIKQEFDRLLERFGGRRG